MFDILGSLHGIAGKYSDAEMNATMVWEGDFSSSARSAVGMDLGIVWGPLSTTTDHEYSAFYPATSDGPISLRFNDNWYPDNQPGYVMHVEIYAALPSSPGNLTAVQDRPNKQIDLAWNNFATGGTVMAQQLVRWFCSEDVRYFR